ncbi:integrase catalytic domain-containing protein [Trichonephila inaurata madagascariensis]|uniref:RNA-directed DNA polymerase n=1 Tax=Trichonephila inaurata madagascariensis TaxID=2747483 RepID=A0A8X6Y0A4_9ARAC|nr:integrase catalytic domain-containing protein [Trichonephila inaurata madagascariensis]
MPRPRPFVPASERRRVFDALRGLSHPGSRATARLISTRFAWSRVQSDCCTWARACLRCQRAKITRHDSSLLQSFAATSLRFRYIHIDIIGPLPPAKSYRYCLTATDRLSRWVEAWPLESITAEDVTQALFAGWISRFGSPGKNYN